MRVLVFGSLNLDHFYGVDHIGAPGETVSSRSLAVRCGGKGLNQSIALARAGCPVLHAGRVGPDGGPLRDALRDAGVDVRFVETVETPSGHAVIQVDRNGQNAILVHGGANRSIDAAFVDRVLAAFGPGDLLLVQNEISERDRLLSAAAARGLSVCVNPSPIDDGLLRAPLDAVRTLLLNETEGRLLTGESDPERIVAALVARSPGREVVLTLGGDGVLHGERDARIRVPAFRVPVVDTTAAGDTFTGFFLAARVRGCGTETALRHATAAASLCVTRAGAADSIPTWDEAAAFLETASR